MPTGMVRKADPTLAQEVGHPSPPKGTEGQRWEERGPSRGRKITNEQGQKKNVSKKRKKKSGRCQV